MEVVWSDLALTQLDEVLDYVEEHFGLLTSQEVLHNILEKTDELAQYSTHGIYDARYTSWVSGQNMVIRHLLIAPNRVYYLIDGEQVVIMGIVHVKRSPQAVTSMIKRFLEEYDKPTKLYLLALPNQEIRVGLYGSLLPHYLMDKSAKANTTIAKMSVLVKKGDVDAAFCLLNNFLETVPYCDNTNYEGHWQQTLYIMFALLTNYSILVEPHTAKGRIDIMMETDDAIYVMELKFNKSAEEALAQIDAKHYADAFKMSGKTS